MRASACMLGVALLVSGGALAQQMYRWVEKDGRVVYSDQSPPAGAREVQQIRAGRPGMIESTPDYALKKAQQDFPVTLYRSVECDAACTDARALLARRGVPFTEIAIRSAQDQDAFRQAFGSTQVSVPSLLVGSQKQIGFEPGLWNRMLDDAGYPRTVVRPAAVAPPALPAARQ